MSSELKTKQDCRRFAALRLQEADGLVPTDAQRRFKAQHLADCASCRMETAAQTAVRYHDEDDSPAAPIDELNRHRIIHDVVERALAPSKDAQPAPVAPANDLQGAPVFSETMRRTVLRWAMAAAVIAGGILGLWIGLRSKDESGRTTDRPQHAHILLAAGTVQVSGQHAAAGGRLQAGQQVHVQKGKAAVELLRGSYVVLGSGAQMSVEQLRGRQTMLRLDRGRLVASVTPRSGRGMFVVRTPHGNVAVVGTMFAVQVTDRAVSVQVLRGKVRVEEPRKKKRTVTRGHATELGGDGAVRRLKNQEMQGVLEEVASVEIMRAERPARLEVKSQPPGAVVRIDGVKIGCTPLTAAVRAGHRRLSLALPGHSAVHELMALNAGARVSRDFDLEKRPQTAAPDSPVDEDSLKGTDDGGEARTKAAAGRPQRPRPAERVDTHRTPQQLLAEARRKRARKDWSGAAAAYRKLIRMHPGTYAGRSALVALGVLELDHLANSNTALQLFERYLRTTRTGVLAQEAAYGKTRALRRLGRREKEKKALQAFLHRYPQAPQIGLVKRRLRALGGRASEGRK
jgi:ferric-dicitrate binding protein FerR (iron transport regulator)